MSTELIEKTVNNINLSSEKFSKAISKLNGMDGTLPRLLNDNSIYNNIDSLILNLQSLFQNTL